MAPPPSFLFFSLTATIFLTTATFLLNPIGCYGHSSTSSTHKSLFVFGDSLFDPGNDHYLNNTKIKNAGASLPYGETYFKRPTGRISDGRIVPDFIAQFAKLPILGPYLKPDAHNFTYGANFAAAGGAVLDDPSSGTMDLRAQLRAFKEVKKSLTEKMGSEETEKALRRAVYLFSIGGNDYFRFYTANANNATDAYKRQYIATVVGNLTDVLKEVYELGGRKIAFQNAGPLGCTAGQIASNPNPKPGRICDDALSSLASQHNKALSHALKKLEAHLPGFKYALFDYFNSLGDRVLNPTKYGFKKGTVACVSQGKGGSNPGDYVFFDGAHTTEKTNYQLAQLMWFGSPNVTGPYNVMQLFAHV